MYLRSFSVRIQEDVHPFHYIIDHDRLMSLAILEEYFVFRASSHLRVTVELLVRFLLDAVAICQDSVSLIHELRGEGILLDAASRPGSDSGSTDYLSRSISQEQKRNKSNVEG